MPTPTRNFPLFHCSCSPSAIAGPSSLVLPPSAYSLHPLQTLYFCDGCDAIRCDSCVTAEVASYFCPGCLFEVANASVKGDRARCARACFECPICYQKLSLGPSDIALGHLGNGASSSKLPERSMGKAPYVLSCGGCRWSSESLGEEWMFEKGGNVAQQILDVSRSHPSAVELESLHTHYDTHLTTLKKFAESNPKSIPMGTKGSAYDKDKSGRSRSAAPPGTGKKRSTEATPGPTTTTLSGKDSTVSRQIGSAAAALAASHSKPRNPGLTRLAHGSSSQASGTPGGSGRVKSSTFLARPVDRVAWTKRPVILPKRPDEEWGVYEAGQKWGMERDGGEEDFEADETPANLKLAQVWEKSWSDVGSQSSLIPQRLPLLSKLTKRCPTCSHTLIRPDPKPTSVRHKIKILAGQYLPAVEVGNERLLGEEVGGMGGEGDRQGLGVEMRDGRKYTFQLAFTNPLLDTISLVLHPPTELPGYNLNIADTAFPIGAFAEPWEIDADLDEAGGRGGAAKGRSRMSVLPPRGGVLALEKKGNVTKVGLLLGVVEGARGRIQFDLPIAMTYRAEEELDPVTGKASAVSGSEVDKAPKTKEVMKTFSFTVRVDLGKVCVQRSVA